MSAVKFFKTITKDQDLNSIQDNLINVLNPVFNTPILNGTLLQSVPLITGSNTIEHKLGRKLLGWVITRQRSLASVYDTQDTNPLPTRTLLLTSNADVICDIYCF